jgi:hypothetical protein
VLKPHTTLEQSIAARQVTRMRSRKISNLYWKWCSIHARPYLAIAIDTSRSRYASVELDLYGLDAGGFDRSAGKEVLRGVLSYPLKANSSFLISPIYVLAYVDAKAAQSLSLFLYQSAQEALSLRMITHEEWISGELQERSREGGPRKSAFAPILGEFRSEVVKAMLNDVEAVLNS